MQVCAHFCVYVRARVNTFPCLCVRARLKARNFAAKQVSFKNCRIDVTAHHESDFQASSNGPIQHHHSGFVITALHLQRDQ